MRQFPSHIWQFREKDCGTAKKRKCLSSLEKNTPHNASKTGQGEFLSPKQYCGRLLRKMTQHNGVGKMRKPKIYLETTIFNYYFDKERDAHADTVALFNEIKAGKYEAYTSAYVVAELEETKDTVKRDNMLALIEEYNITVLDYSDDAKELANVYINEGVLPSSKMVDSLHISIAIVSDLQYIFSFNFQHINRVKTKTMVNLINAREGYKSILIAVPAEVLDYGESK